MKAGAIVSVEKKGAKRIEEAVTCIGCDRTMKNPSEWVRSGAVVMCNSCYESLINPFPKCCAGGA